MRSLQNRLKKIGEELAEATGAKTYHYHAPNRPEAPYVVWAEDGEGDGSFHADTKKAEQNIHLYIDYFTLTEFDPAVDAIQELIQYSPEWRLNDVMYEDETNLIHYVWEANA